MPQYRLLIDGSMTRPEQGGIRTYARGVAEALAQRADTEVFVVGSAEVAPTGVNNINVDGSTYHPASRAVWRERHFRRIVREVGVDALLVPSHELPITSVGVPEVMVVHDVGPLVAPMFYGRKRQLRYSVMLPYACRRADAIVAASQTTRRELLGNVNVEPGKVRVIGQSVQRLPSASPDSTDSTGSYLLYAGALLPHKNLETVLEMLRSHPEMKSFNLVVVGPDYEGERTAFRERVGSMGLADRVRHLGFVSGTELARLYACAFAFVLPSLHEGFGIPAVQAMSVGLPLVASEIPALREVAGNGAIFVRDPLSPAEWGDAVLRLEREPQLRARTIEQGLRQSDSYNWAGWPPPIATSLLSYATEGDSRASCERCGAARRRRACVKAGNTRRVRSRGTNARQQRLQRPRLQRGRGRRDADPPRAFVAHRPARPQMAFQ